jgi:hypothetical protein
MNGAVEYLLSLIQLMNLRVVWNFQLELVVR